MSTDWQAYEDGSLRGEELSHAQLILGSDRRARAEVEGIRALKKALREAALAEEVPTDALKRALAQTAKIRRPFRRPLALAVTFAAAAAVVLALWVGPSIIQGPVSQPAQVVAAEQFPTTDPVTAHTWLVSHSHQRAPYITAKACHGKLVNAKYGPDWIAWDVMLDGHQYTIVGKHSDKVDVSDTTPTNIEGIDFMIKGDQIGWECEMGMVYFVSGGTSAGRNAVACALRFETPTIRRV